MYNSLRSCSLHTLHPPPYAIQNHIFSSFQFSICICSCIDWRYSMVSSASCIIVVALLLEPTKGKEYNTHGSRSKGREKKKRKKYDSKGKIIICNRNIEKWLKLGELWWMILFLILLLLLFSDLLQRLWISTSRGIIWEESTRRRGGRFCSSPEEHYHQGRLVLCHGILWEAVLWGVKAIFGQITASPDNHPNSNIPILSKLNGNSDNTQI